MLRDLFSLFPAYAGVILREKGGGIMAYPFPRIRGGDPRRPPGRRKAQGLFPAYAGVIPLRLLPLSLPAPFPRIRGGDPNEAHFNQIPQTFSPHTRG